MLPKFETHPDPVIAHDTEAVPNPFVWIDYVIAENRHNYPGDMSVQLPVIGETGIFDTPPAVQSRDEIVTNPSQPILIRTPDGEKNRLLAYFRQEPRDSHLGRTMAVPYLIERRADGRLHLNEYIDAGVVAGEDARLKTRIALPGHLGKIHEGFCVSTVVARPDPNKKNGALYEQVFLWGETLDRLEQVTEGIDKNKCVCVTPVIPGEVPLYVAGRPHPHITFKTLEGGLQAIDRNSVFEDALVITEKMAFQDVHHGSNNLQVVRYGDNPVVALDAHHAYGPYLNGIKYLNYRSDDWLIYPRHGKMAHLGTFVTRQNFPDGQSKPPSDGVNYDNIVYGARGKLGRVVGGIALFGLNDTQAGWARMVHPQQLAYYRRLQTQARFMLAA